MSKAKSSASGKGKKIKEVKAKKAYRGQGK